jgi:hypothetical protein
MLENGTLAAVGALLLLLLLLLAGAALVLVVLDLLLPHAARPSTSAPTIASLLRVISLLPQFDI